MIGKILIAICLLLLAAVIVGFGAFFITILLMLGNDNED